MKRTRNDTPIDKSSSSASSSSSTNVDDKNENVKTQQQQEESPPHSPITIPARGRVYSVRQSYGRDHPSWPNFQMTSTALTLDNEGREMKIQVFISPIYISYKTNIIFDRFQGIPKPINRITTGPALIRIYLGNPDLGIQLNNWQLSFANEDITFEFARDEPIEWSFLLDIVNSFRMERGQNPILLPDPLSYDREGGRDGPRSNGTNNDNDHMSSRQQRHTEAYQELEARQQGFLFQLMGGGHPPIQFTFGGGAPPHSFSTMVDPFFRDNASEQEQEAFARIYDRQMQAEHQQKRQKVPLSSRYLIYILPSPLQKN